MRSAQAAVVGGCRRPLAKEQSTVLSLSAPGATIRLPTGNSSLFYAARQSRGVVSKRHEECAPASEPQEERVFVPHAQDVEAGGSEDESASCVQQQGKRVTSQCLGPGIASLTCNPGPKSALCRVLASQSVCGTLQCVACVVLGFFLGAMWRDSAHNVARARNDSAL